MFVLGRCFSLSWLGRIFGSCAGSGRVKARRRGIRLLRTHLSHNYCETKHHHRFKLSVTPLSSENIWWLSKRTILECSILPPGIEGVKIRTPSLICQFPVYGSGCLGFCDGTENLPSAENVIVLPGADCFQVPRICLRKMTSLASCRLQAVSSRLAVIIMCVCFIEFNVA